MIELLTYILAQANKSITEITQKARKIAEQDYKKKVEDLLKLRDLDILLAMNKSFASYDRERKLEELETKENASPVKESPTVVKWERTEFNREALLSKVEMMKGAKVKCLLGLKMLIFLVYVFPLKQPPITRHFLTRQF